MGLCFLFPYSWVVQQNFITRLQQHNLFSYNHYSTQSFLEQKWEMYTHYKRFQWLEGIRKINEISISGTPTNYLKMGYRENASYWSIFILFYSIQWTKNTCFKMWLLTFFKIVEGRYEIICKLTQIPQNEHIPSKIHHNWTSSLA